MGEIGERAFAECHKLKEVITDYDTSIDENAFEGCHQKVKITYFSEDEKIGKHFIENLRIVNSLIDDEGLYVLYHFFILCADDLCFTVF